MTKISGECLQSCLRSVIVSVSYPFANPIGVVLRLLDIVISIGSAYVLTAIFPFLSGVQVDTIKLHYFRNLYFSLNLFEVCDRRFDSRWAHWDFSLT